MGIKTLVFLILPLLLPASSFAIGQVRTVGVSVGNSFKHSVTFSWNSTDPNMAMPYYYQAASEMEWLSYSIVDVSGTNVTAQAMMHFRNGTELAQTVITDVDTGNGNSTYWVVAANLDVNDAVYTSTMYSSTCINETITKSYPDGPRSINHLNIAIEINTTDAYQYISQNIYWDKQTGFMVEMALVQISQTNVSRETTSILVAITESNLWVVGQNASVNVVPASATIGINDELVLNVTLSDVPAPGLYSYQFKLHFDPAILEVFRAEIPSDHMLRPSLKPSNIFIVDSGTIDKVGGFASFALTLLSDEPGKTGSGVLCTIALWGKAVGNSSVTLESVILVDPDAVVFPDGSFTLNNGTVTVQSSGAWDYSFSDSSGKGTLLNIDTVNGLFQFITPDGDYGTRKATDMQIGKTIVTNDGFKVGSSTDIVIWVMHEDAELRLTALAFPKQDLCWAKAYDLRTDELYKLVRWPWRQDVNKDGKVNIQDITIVAKNFGSKPDDPIGNQDADIDENGQINIEDISKVAKDFGKIA